METLSPIAQLRQLEKDVLHHDLESPVVEDVKSEVWSGMLFRVLGVMCVAPMSEVGEVLSPPEVVIVPGTREWVVGLANVRGSLVPVVDLNAGLLERAASERVRGNRVLVVKRESDSVLTGLFTAAVPGIRSFEMSQAKVTDISDVPKQLAPFIRGVVESEGEVVPLVSLIDICESPSFSDLAASVIEGS